jgi:hypothetical protein
VVNKAQPYEMHGIRLVVKDTNVLMREYALDPGEAIP